MREDNMKAYLKKVKELKNFLIEAKIEKIPRDENLQANGLARMAWKREVILPITVIIERVLKPSIVGDHPLGMNFMVIRDHR